MAPMLRGGPAAGYWNQALVITDSQPRTVPLTVNGAEICSLPGLHGHAL
jgi:hypothetical protein